MTSIDLRQAPGLTCVSAGDWCYRLSETCPPNIWRCIFFRVPEKRVGVPIPRKVGMSARFLFSERPERTFPMTPEQNKTAEKMTSVKAAWDKAPAGPKKDAALKHYQAAEKANTAKNDAETNKELDAATHALA